MPKWTLANSMDLYLYPRLFEPFFREFFGKAARFCSRQNVEFERAFLLVLLDRHSECMCHCVDTGKAQNTLGGFKMTIENARVLQEQLANEAIVQQQKNGSKELADDCIQSIAIVGKAWGIPADETTRWQHAQQKQTRRVGGAEPRENTADSDMLHPAPGKAVKVMQLVWDMFETALDLGDDADRYRLFDTAHTLAAVYLLPDWLGAKPIVKYHDLQPLPHQYVPARY